MTDKRIYNKDLLEAIHDLDKKLVNHLGLINNHTKAIKEIRDDVYDHNEEGGIKFQNKTMWQERKEKKKISIEVKIAIALSLVNGLAGAGKLLDLI